MQNEKETSKLDRFINGFEFNLSEAEGSVENLANKLNQISCSPVGVIDQISKKENADFISKIEVCLDRFIRINDALKYLNTKFEEII